MAPPFLSILFSIVASVHSYTKEKEMLENWFILFLYFLVAIIATYFSLRLYNYNPQANYFGPRSFTKQKTENEEKTRKYFESNDKVRTKFKGEWGGK